MEKEGVCLIIRKNSQIFKINNSNINLIIIFFLLIITIITKIMQIMDKNLLIEIKYTSGH